MTLRPKYVIGGSYERYICFNEWDDEGTNFRLRLINGFNFSPIVANAIVDLSKDLFQNENSGVCNGQILYLAISDEEGPGKSVLDSKHVEVILTLDAPEDMDVYEKFGLSAYRQHILLRITQEAREQNDLLTIKDLVKLLKSSYSTIKRDLKYFREKEIYVPLRGIIKDIGPSSHKSKIVELYLKGYTPIEIQKSTSSSAVARCFIDLSVSESSCQPHTSSSTATRLTK